MLSPDFQCCMSRFREIRKFSGVTKLVEETYAGLDSLEDTKRFAYAF